MSKIAVAGNASGTGTLTIAAPNTNSDRTLTLPDVTATVITDSAGVLNIGSGQVYKDGSGNVGIGTSSPLTGLSLSRSGTQWTNNSANTYPVPAGRTFVQMEAVAAQANWFGFTGAYGATSGSANLLLQVNLNNTSQQAGNYIASEAQSATAADLTFGKMVAGATTGANSAKSEQMRITSAGNVGIGTSSPISNGGYGGLTLNGTNGALFSMMTNGTESSRIASLGDVTSIQCKASTGYISFVQGVSGGSERMRLDSSGNLGLGVTPSAWAGNFRATQIGQGAYIAGRTDAVALYMGSNGFWNGSNDRYIADGFATDYYQAIGGHVWRTAPSGTAGDAITFTQAMTLDASGNLGVGLANPSTYGKLSVNGNIAQYGNVAIGSELGRIAWFNTATGYDVASIRTFIGAGQVNRGEFGFYTNNGAGQNLAMYIDRVQQVTVGATSTPIGQLGSKLSDVTTTFANLSYGMLGLQNTSNTANNYTWMTFNESYGNYTGAIGTQNITHAAASSTVVGDMVFATKQSGIGGFPTEKVRITSAGNFGVGETNPTFKLDVKTTANNIAAFESQASSYPSSSIYNAVIGRGTNIIPPSTTTTLALGYGGGIALIVMRGDTGVADTQYTYLVTWAWNSATVLFVNTYGTFATTSTFTASSGQLQVNHNHSGACFFGVSVLTNGEN